MTVDAQTPAGHRDRILREAGRAWWRAGVRRRDRRLLAGDLSAELDAAAAEASMADVLGEDPARSAIEWARARGLTDRRLRLAVVVLPALLAGVIAAGGLLVALSDAFTGDGRSLLDRVSGSAVGLLSVYALGGFLAFGAILLVAWAMLRAVGDSTAAWTARALAWALPAGAVAAVAAGVAVAAQLQYAVHPRTVVAVGTAVLAVLVAAIVVARCVAVGRPRPTSGSCSAAAGGEWR